MEQPILAVAVKTAALLLVLLLPLVGDAAMKAWEHLASMEIGGLASKAAPYACDVTKWLISQAGGIGGMLVHFFLSIVVAAILYWSGEGAAAAIGSQERAGKIPYALPAKPSGAWRLA